MDNALSSDLPPPQPGFLERITWAPVALLGVGVIAASLSAILIRYAQEAHPLAISFWRSAIGAAVLAPFARRDLRSVKTAGYPLPVLAGVFLALHFGTWIWSLELTTVAASVLLLSTTPVFVALVAWRFLAERLGRAGWIGIALTVIGAAAVGGADLSGSHLTGNILALIGGATVGAYTLAGQFARRTLGILGYAVIAYSVAAVALLAVCVVTDVSLWGYRSDTWLAIAAIVVGPQLLGHTIINLVLKQIDATMISAAIMAEPLIAVSLAAVLFGEVPGLLIYPAGAAILAGIYLVSTARRSPPELIE